MRDFNKLVKMHATSDIQKSRYEAGQTTQIPRGNEKTKREIQIGVPKMGGIEEIETGKCIGA